MRKDLSENITSVCIWRKAYLSKNVCNIIYAKQKFIFLNRIFPLTMKNNFIDTFKDIKIRNLLFLSFNKSQANKSSGFAF